MRFDRLALATLALAAGGVATAQSPVAAIQGDPRVREALAALKAAEPQTVAEQRAITEIPAPPFKEQVRAQDYARRLREAGLADVRIDQTGNVIALRKGTGGGPLLVFSAHLDTVFPEGDDVKTTERDGRIHGRGISDDGRGLAVVLAVVRAMEQARLRTVGDVMIVATVGEEGLGDLRGARAIVKEHPGLDGFITVEPSGSEKLVITNGGTGSRRWALTFRGPGGHSFGAFGQPSAIHAMGRAIAGIDEVRVPESPKTTFNVGIVEGGTSVNTIAASATMQVDIRSDGAAELATAEKAVLAAAEAAVEAENRRWNTNTISLERKLIGDRGAGLTPANSPMVSVARDAIIALGQAQPGLSAGSSDANAAMAAGVPGIALGGGGRSGGAHSREEWFEPRESWLGPQAALLTVLGLAGLDGVTKPALADRPAR